MYIARHYVRVNGKMFTPGEIITEDIAENKVGRLLEKGAVSKMETAPVLNERGPAPDGKQEDDKTDYSAPVASVLPEPEEDDDADGAEDEEEADEEAEAPEIDVTDGIVAEPEPEEAPAATTRKRSTKKK